MAVLYLCIYCCFRNSLPNKPYVECTYKLLAFRNAFLHITHELFKYTKEKLQKLYKRGRSRNVEKARRFVNDQNSYGQDMAGVTDAW